MEGRKNPESQILKDQLDRNGILTQVVSAAIIRGMAQGVVPNRQHITGRLPLNPMKPEKLVWVIQNTEYLEVVTRRERTGSSHRLSIRVARDGYCRPGTFRSRPVEWEKTMHAHSGMLGSSTKQRKNVLNLDDVQTLPTCLCQRTRHPRCR